MPYGGGPVQRDMGVSHGATEVKLLEYTTTKLSDVVYFQEGPGVRKWDFHEEGTRIMNIRLIQPDGTLEVSDSRFVSDEFAFGKWKHFLLDEDSLDDDDLYESPVISSINSNSTATSDQTYNQASQNMTDQNQNLIILILGK